MVKLILIGIDKLDNIKLRFKFICLYLNISIHIDRFFLEKSTCIYDRDLQRFQTFKFFTPVEENTISIRIVSQKQRKKKNRFGLEHRP